MTTIELLELDCRAEENKIKIQKALKMIKPLSKEKDIVPLEKIERAIKVMCSKYRLCVRELVPDTESGEGCIIWRASIIDIVTLKTIGCIYGCTIYETIAKIVIFLYSEVRRRKRDS